MSEENKPEEKLDPKEIRPDRFTWSEDEVKYIPKDQKRP